MSKSIEQLRQLSVNPYYHMSDEEKLQLLQAEQQENATTEPDGSPKGFVFRESALVKEIGRLDKHSGDPVVDTEI